MSELKMVPIMVPANMLKTIREDLCVAQSAVSYYRATISPNTPITRITRLGDLINQIDINRPLGSNGKHGNLHTDTCGCED